MTRPRKLYVKSFGCQLNVYDSHRMADMLAPEGFAETAHIEDADLVILNTCHIREKAADKVYSELGRMRALKAAAARNGRRSTVAVAGCVAQAEGEEIIRRAPVVDLVVGPQNYHRLPGLLARAQRVRAVTLIGQNVNAYHGEGPDRAAWTLGRLLERVAELPGIARLRYTTSHPCDMEASLVAAHRDLPSLMPYLHLPVQSGSDRILARMNRRHTRADYLDAIARMRDARSDFAFSSDFIVGFPGESEDDFRATLSLIDEVHYASAFSFKYSARPGTPAAEMDDQIPDEVKTERLYRLQAAIDRHQAKFNAECVGRTFEILFDKPGRYPGQIVGRSPYLQPVQVMAPPTMIGDIAAVKITQRSTNSLFGALVEASMSAEPMLTEG